jgi:hypothetical protein
MKLIVQSPIQEVKNTGAGGVVKQQQTLKVRLSDGDNKLEDGVFLKADTELVIVITDPAKFEKYKIGDAVTMTLA